MSEDVPMKLTLAEKLIGLVLIIVGALTTYYSLNLPPGETSEFSGIMIIIGSVARVLLADGKIDKREEKLMKEYLVACGIPKSLYKDIINKVKSDMEG